MMMLHTSMRKPSTPRSNQNRRMSSNVGAHVFVPPVEVGLHAQVVVHVVLAGRRVERPGRAAEAADPVVRRRTVGLRDRPRRTSRGARAVRDERDSTNHGCSVARVVRHEVEQHADAARGARPRRAASTSASVPDLGLHRAVVGDVVAPVGVRRDGDRAQPDPVDAEPLADGRGARRCPRRSPNPSPFESANDSG